MLGESDEEEAPYDPDARYTKLIGNDLWGCSCRESLVRVEVLQHECDLAAPAHPERQGGLTDRLRKVRDDFMRDAVVEEGRTIPKGKQFKVHIPCRLKHPGICRKKVSPAIAITNKAMAQQLFKETAGTLLAVEGCALTAPGRSGTQ